MRYPLLVANLGYMQVVRHCNQYCRFCSNPATGWMLDYDTACREIDDFVARGYFGIILTGGEPSLSDLIPEITRYAVSKGLHVRMITNGSRVAKREIAERYVTWPIIRATASPAAGASSSS